VTPLEDAWSCRTRQGVDPNCCEQPVTTGCDNCNQPVPHVINVPDIGALPVTVTITGDNSPATYDDYPAHCDSGIFNEDGGTKDPGWWEIFTLTDCAEIRIDFCCTDIDGEPLRPAWGNLVRDEADGGICCDTWFGSNGVDPPIGIGRDTSGFARGAPFCAADNLWSTYGPMRAGKYQYPIYSAPGGTSASPPGAGYQLHITVGACPVSACCVGEVCSIVNELECRDLDGYWHRGVVDCGTQPDCSIPGSDGLCCTGSCCTGPGECVDETPGGVPITKADCDGLGGDYVGGAVCASDPPPCPVCDIEGASNCQLPDLNSPDLTMMSDLSMVPHGVVVADDFIPATSEPLQTVCVWGNYLDAVEIRAAAAQNDGDDCNDDVVDDFRIMVYPDLDGKPDDKNPIDYVEDRAVIIIAKGAVDSTYGSATLYPDAQMYAYQLQLDPPIVGMAQGVKHWIEITNNTADDIDGGRCMWHWAQTSIEANNFSYVGTDLGFKNPAYMYGGGRAGPAGDMAFCVNMALTVPPPVEGTCCDCDTGLCSVTTLGDCTTGQWDQMGDCAGLCPWDPTGGDEGTGAMIVPGDLCLVNPIVTSDPNFTYTYDSSCAGTDGSEDELSELGIIGIGADIWVHYIAPCDGKLHVSMCGVGNADNSYDSALAVYKDSSDSTNCACPGDPGFTRVGIAQDESCNGIADGGAGYLTPPPIAGIGDCYTVRVAGFDAAGGAGTIKIGCEIALCTPTPQPLPDPRVVDFGSGSRNRYLSFTTARDDGTPEAMRVTFDSLPPPLDVYDGDQWFVGQPVEVTEASCCNDPTPPPTVWMASLQCGTPHYDDWASYGIVHVYDAGIIPSATYAIQAIADDCNIADEESYSAALPISTSMLGDIVGDCGVQPCSPPQGVIDFVDISGCVDKFRNLPAAPQKARADVINSNITAPPPDKKIDFVDISVVVDAFRGSPPPMPGPERRTGSSVPPTTSIWESPRYLHLGGSSLFAVRSRQVQTLTIGSARTTAADAHGAHLSARHRDLDTPKSRVILAGLCESCGYPRYAWQFTCCRSLRRRQWPAPHLAHDPGSWT